MSGTICRPRTVYGRTVTWCPTCGRRRRMAGLMAAWYPTVLGCTACGDAWAEGERMERPFAPGWRRRHAATYRRWWDEGCRWDAAMRRVMQEVRREIESDDE